MTEDPILLRDLQLTDRADIATILSASRVFRPDEIATALSLVEETLAPREDTDYRWIIAQGAEFVVGFACFGPVPMTDGTFDLYWIAVDPTQTRRGIAARLDAEVTRQIQARPGTRWLLAETSSTAPYRPAQAFYARQGYDLVGRIVDYYRPGDDRLTYGKRLDGERTDVSDQPHPRDASRP